MSAIDRFAQILADRHFTVSVRKSRGQDIRAACGQLIVEGGVKKSAAQQMALLIWVTHGRATAPRFPLHRDPRIPRARLADSNLQIVSGHHRRSVIDGQRCDRRAHLRSRNSAASVRPIARIVAPASANVVAVDLR